MASNHLMVGRVNSDRQAIVQIVVTDASERRHRFDAIIDTGYDGTLSLPPEIAGELGLPLVRRGMAVMADGRVATFDIHYGTVMWFGQSRRIRIDALDSPPIIGMELLNNHLLTILVATGGEVTIKRF